jgi:type IV conjugative transfer system coupling protein TraD
MPSIMSGLVRGGQTSYHSIAMFKQVIQKTLVLLIWIYLATMGSIFYTKTTPMERSIFMNYLLAEHLGFLIKNVVIDGKNGQKYLIDKNKFLEKREVSDSVKVTEEIVWRSLIMASYYMLGLTLIIFSFFVWRGFVKSGGQYIRGARIISSKALKKLLILKRDASKFTIGEVPLKKNSEMQHIILLGSPGVGKTQAIFELLDRVKQQGQKAIIYDVEGVYTRRYYNSSKDFLLNPLDKRDAKWSPWADMIGKMNIASLASSLIQDSNSMADPFWYQAARTIFEEAMERLIQEGREDTQVLLDLLCRKGIEDLQVVLKNTFAEALVASEIEKTALSVKSILTANLKRLEFLCKDGASFSIREWIKKEDDSWLFITSREDLHEALKPIITAYIDIVSNCLLTLEENRERRIWFVTDEIHTIGQSNSYMQLAARGRKRGVCIVAGLQSMRQMDDVFGKNGAEKISGMFSTRVYFRNSDLETARWISKSLGEQEIFEYTEGESYGSHEMRDGVNLSKQKRMTDLIMKEEIMQLPDLTAYLKIVGDYPLTKVQIEIRETLDGVEAFIADESMTLLRRENASNIVPETSGILEVQIEEKIKAKKKEKWQEVIDF